MTRLAIPPDPADLYEADFHAWTEAQAAALRARRSADLDWAHLTEEIEDLGGSQRREVESRLVILLHHLLKWSHQPDRRSTSWENTIARERVELQLIFDQSRSLRRHAQASYPKAYAIARREAARQMKRDGRRLPAEPPFSIEQALDPDFYPAAAE